MSYTHRGALSRTVLFLFASINDEVIVMQHVRSRIPLPRPGGALLLAALLLSTVLSSPALAQADFHIGIMTGTVSATEDATRGAESLINQYGSTKRGGM
ncbi:DUF3798 domain-containing protein, partial [Fretibacterium fastidiosum]|uniref:DUF3798 domain-containing protein n=1 Tax=Fretibacterium fastidiosum TaxID=651822 RepID=UPI001AD80134